MDVEWGMVVIVEPLRSCSLAWNLGMSIKRSLLEKEWGPGHVIKMSFFGIRPDICSGSYRMEVLELWREVGLL